MVNKLTNGREKQQRMSTPFILVPRKGVVKLIMNFYGSAEGKHPSPWMPCALTELAKQIHQQGSLGHLPGFSDQAERTAACNRWIPMHWTSENSHHKQGCSSLELTYWHLKRTI